MICSRAIIPLLVEAPNESSRPGTRSPSRLREFIGTGDKGLLTTARVTSKWQKNASYAQRVLARIHCKSVKEAATLRLKANVRKPAIQKTVTFEGKTLVNQWKLGKQSFSPKISVTVLASLNRERFGRLLDIYFHLRGYLDCRCVRIMLKGKQDHNFPAVCFTSGWTKLPRKHPIGFVVIATLQVCISDTPLFNYPNTSALPS